MFTTNSFNYILAYQIKNFCFNQYKNNVMLVFIYQATKQLIKLLLFIYLHE
jgi:hypothetical protein